MKSLSESLLSPKVKLDPGEAIKNELKNSVYGLDKVEVTVNGRMLELSTPSHVILSFKPDALKYLASIDIQTIGSNSHMGFVVPVQDHIKDFQLNHKNSNIVISNDYFVPEMAGWNIKAGNITVERVGDMAINSNTFLSISKSNYLYSLVFKGVREWKWRNNEVSGVKAMNLRFVFNAAAKDISTGLMPIKEDINFFLGDPKNLKDLTSFDYTCKRGEASWFRGRPTEEWNFEINR